MHGDRYEIGNAKLQAENAYETDISMHYHGDYFSFDLAGFYNLIDNYIFISPTAELTSTAMTIYRFSQTNAKLYGGEAGIHFHPKIIAVVTCSEYLCIGHRNIGKWNLSSIYPGT